MFKNIVIAAAVLAATPALANTGGHGAGVGGTIGAEVSQGQSFDFSLNGANNVAGSSGSGFNVDMSGFANDSVSVAAFGGVGLASTNTNVNNIGNYGEVNSTSGSAGAFGGIALGDNASFEATAMNFAQSEGRNGFEYTIDASQYQSFEGWGQVGGNFGNWSFDGF